MNDHICLPKQPAYVVASAEDMYPIGNAVLGRRRTDSGIVFVLVWTDQEDVGVDA
ncbi:hypothetical protein Asp14428_56970 [Actinoplanes sp. NBRC 14428]|nr:hypothetical protein Asp14428_56970 [Actinoplanes sp. NBRC 14428]